MDQIPKLVGVFRWVSKPALTLLIASLFAVQFCAASTDSIAVQKQRSFAKQVSFFRGASAQLVSRRDDSDREAVWQGFDDIGLSGLIIGRVDENTCKATSDCPIKRLFNTQVNQTFYTDTYHLTEEETHLFEQIKDNFSFLEGVSAQSETSELMRNLIILKKNRPDLARLLLLSMGKLALKSDDFAALNALRKHYAGLEGQDVGIDLQMLLALARGTGRSSDYVSSLPQLENIYAQILSKERDLLPFWQLEKIRLRANIAFLRYQQSYTSAKRIDDDFTLAELNDSLLQAREINDRVLIAEILGHLATVHWIKNNFERASVLMNESVAELTMLGSKKRLAEASNNLGLLASWMGNYQLALGALTTSLHNSKLLSYPRLEAYVNASLSDLYRGLGEYDWAENTARFSAALFEQQKNAVGQGIALWHLGAASRMRDEHRPAIGSFNRSLDLFSKVEGHEVRVLLIKSELALSLQKLGQHQDAAARLDHDLCKGQTASDLLGSFAPNKLHALINYARFYSEANDPKNAKLCMQQVSAVMAVNKNSAQFYTAKFDYLELLIELSAKNQNSIKFKGMMLSEIDDLFQSSSEQLNAHFLKKSLSAKANKLVRSYVANLMLSREPHHDINAQIHGVLEKYSPFVYLNNDDESESEFNSELNSDADYWRREAIQAENRVIQSSVDERIVNLGDVNFARRMVVSASSKLHSKHPKRRPILNLNEVQKRLTKGRAIARYVFSGNQGFLQLISQADAVVRPLKSDIDIINKRIDSLNEKIRNVRGGFVDDALFLSDALMVPYLYEKGISQLTIIPDAGLHRLTFGVLAVPNKEEYTPLANDIELDYTLSVSDYYSSRPNSKFEADISVLADPKLSSNKVKRPTEDTVATRSFLGNEPIALPFTRKEAHNIKNDFSELDIDIYLDEDANQSVLASQKFRYSKVAHIATHGFYDPEIPDIVGFALSDESGNGIAVTKTFLEGLSFKSRLVVLSGCETGSGRHLSGQGLSSLSQALLKSGVGSVIGSVWPISDRVTAIFMRNFYTELTLKNGNVSSALFAAKRSMSRSARYRHPYYWAGFKLEVANAESIQQIFK